MDSDQVGCEVNFMLWSAELGMVLRSFHMKYWEREADEEEAAEQLRQGPRLESVADHSWHMCDSILAVAHHFPDLDILRCLQLAIVHDKLEIIIGDLPPEGMGSIPGDASHKREREAAALEVYLESCHPTIREAQAQLFREYIAQTTPEAQFVNGVDKLQVYSFLLRKKLGNMEDEHIRFTLEYTRTHLMRCPRLVPHALALEDRLLDQIATFRKSSRASLDRAFGWPGCWTQTDRGIH